MVAFSHHLSEYCATRLKPYFEIWILDARSIFLSYRKKNQIYKVPTYRNLAPQFLVDVSMPLLDEQHAVHTHIPLTTRRLRMKHTRRKTIPVSDCMQIRLQF
ncbi:hypothetical protein Agabi119p4_6872 [Agaricus bisporus var. burnettii]|uniref:Uncharacterized protein n=1 Tax=Agaricus bisporus var. burnettii TaxID=192524 RepID=A0A8H7KCG1_AGABI|nr:hypothetical protein Agabi119p4_6872 [Agaricus bisporus var. burnettii]